METLYKKKKSAVKAYFPDGKRLTCKTLNTSSRNATNKMAGILIQKTLLNFFGKRMDGGFHAAVHIWEISLRGLRLSVRRFLPAGLIDGNMRI